MRKYIITSLLFCLTFNKLTAQTIVQNSGWLALFNTTKFSEQWGVALDVQVRSADNWGYIKNVLVRPGITYFINSNNNVTAGYLHYTSFNRSIGTMDNSQTEQRIWEQYIFTHRLKSFFVTHRARVEQRFIEQTNDDEIFAQRFRYFFRFMLPLQGNINNFENGAFVALQNEVFLNIQNKESLNKSLFDQNRFYLAGGYRFSNKLDLEAGYLKQFSNGVAQNTSNQVIQLALYTRF